MISESKNNKILHTWCTLWVDHVCKILHLLLIFFEFLFIHYANV